MVTNGEMTQLMLVQYIHVAAINPSTLNRHCADEDPDVVELAQTIRENGLISPITIRPRDKDRYEIICGERRWRAFRINGQDEIPAIVKDLDDTQAQIERIVENFQRRDPSFMEQGEAVATLMELTNQDISEIANRLGQSISWVRRRSRLPNLIAEWKTELEKPDTVYAAIRDSVNKLEEIAILPADTQKILLEKNVLRYPGTVKEMRTTIARYFMDLDEKPWTRAWEKKAFTGYGKKRCDACHRRSDRDNVLFDNPDMPCSGKKMCLDPECWKNKCLSWCKHLLSTNQDMVPVMRGYVHSGDGTKLAEYFGVTPLSSWSVEDRDIDTDTGAAEEQREGYTPGFGVYVDGPEIGTTYAVWLRDSTGDEEDDEDGSASAMRDWRENRATAYETRQALTVIMKAEIAAYLAEIDTHATATLAEVRDNQIRAACWFGFAGFMENCDDETRIDDPAWNPITCAWEGTTECIADFVANITASNECGFNNFSYSETDKDNAKSLCTMFAIPLDLITTKALAELAEATGIGQDAAPAYGSRNDNEKEDETTIAAIAEPLTDETDALYFDSIPTEKSDSFAVDFPLVPVDAEFSTVG